MKEPQENRIRVAAAQYFIRPIQRYEQFVDQVTAVVETAADYRCSLLVLPEYFSIQLVSLHDTKRPFHEQIREAASYHDRFVDLMRELAKDNGLYLVAGTFPVLDAATDAVYNDCYFFAPSGAYDVQGKLHMTRFEKEDWLVQPRNRLKVFDTEFGKIAIAICYDVEFPELVRAVANEGVHLLAVPSNTDDRQGFLRVRYCAHARAIENQMYVIHAPTVGSLPRVPDVSLNYGQAAILTPSDFAFARDGILAQGELNQETLIIGELDIELVERSRSFGTVLPLEDSRLTQKLVASIETVRL